MSTLNISMAKVSSSPITYLRAWVSRMWAFNKLLTISAIFYAILIPVFTIAAIVDPVLITNTPAFVKPLKFTISLAIYTATFVWLLTLVKGHKWFVQSLANITALGFLIEMIIVVLQAIRGVPSHFNITTPFNQMMYSIMGLTIVFVALMNLLLGIWLLFQRLPDPVIAWSIRLGLLISFAGMLVAVLMTSQPTAHQKAQMEAGQEITAMGGHSVGVEDGGPGLPLVGWSTEGGDLRVPHFIGLHAMQVLPLLGWALSRRRQLSQRQRLVLIWGAGVAYFGFMGLLTWQALRGQSVIAPDALTWSAYAALIGFVALIELFTFAVLQPGQELSAIAVQE